MSPVESLVGIGFKKSEAILAACSHIEKFIGRAKIVEVRHERAGRQLDALA